MFKSRQHGLEPELFTIIPPFLSFSPQNIGTGLASKTKLLSKCFFLYILLQ